MDAVGVVLAAGLSRRAGGFKLTFPLAGRPLVWHAVAALGAACGRVLVVTGHRAAEVRAALADCPCDVEWVHHAGYRAGMFSSVKAGLRRVRADACLLLPGDMPFVSADTCRRLLAAPGQLAVPSCAGRRGHPLRIAAPLLPSILAWPDDSSLRNFLRGRELLELPVDDPGVLTDIDSVADRRRHLDGEGLEDAAGRRV